ncbi:MAG: RNA methyltransferase [Gammaproteobacteria bacterium]|nr:RNA methyltransferase [Gammaproteobacteria bacterium]
MTEGYEAKKAYFDSLLTLFGRKPVREALEAGQVEAVCLHLADSNRASAELDTIIELTRSQGGEIKYHTREALSRISKNRRQDQGVAIDIRAPAYQPLSAALGQAVGARGLIAVDHVTNPQNLGMIIRAVGASPRDGIIFARSGNAGIDGLVIKASAGALFKTPIFHCERLDEGLTTLKTAGYAIYGLAGGGRNTLNDVPADQRHVLVLGNETHGISAGIRSLCDEILTIPMAHDIESLNVAVAAGVAAFAPLFTHCEDP